MHKRLFHSVQWLTLMVLIMAQSISLQASTDNQPISSVTDITDPGTYYIDDRDGLNALATFVNRGSGTLGYTFEIQTLEQRIDVSQWIPIGTKESPFQGIFRNPFYQGVLNDLSINGDYEDAGFFGVIGSGAIIESLWINNAFIESSGAAGVIAGRVLEGALIQDALITQDISSNAISIQSLTHIGMVVGVNAGVIERVTVLTLDVELKGSVASYVGGLVGHNQGVIRRSMVDIAFLNVLPPSNEEEPFVSAAGGLVGLNEGTIQSIKVVLNEIAMDATYLGGVVGHNTASGTLDTSLFVNNFPDSDVQDVLNGSIVGAFVGVNEGQIARSVASAPSVSVSGLTSGIFAGSGMVSGNAVVTAGDFVQLGHPDVTSGLGTVRANQLLSFLNQGTSDDFILRSGLNATDQQESYPELHFDHLHSSLSLQQLYCLGWVVCSDNLIEEDSGVTLRVKTREDLFNVSLFINDRDIDFDGLDYGTAAIELVADLNFSSLIYDVYSVFLGDNVRFYFDPIGTLDNPFMGTFEGNNHTIRGLASLHDVTTRTSGVGTLFGAVEGVTIQNLVLQDAIIFVASYNPDDAVIAYVGGLVGIALDSTIRDVHVESTVFIHMNESFNFQPGPDEFPTNTVHAVGGLVGFAYNVSIESVEVLPLVVVSSSFTYGVGGVVGSYQGGLFLSGVVVSPLLALNDSSDEVVRRLNTVIEEAIPYSDATFLGYLIGIHRDQNVTQGIGGFVGGTLPSFVQLDVTFQLRIEYSRIVPRTMDLLSQPSPMIYLTSRVVEGVGGAVGVLLGSGSFVHNDVMTFISVFLSDESNDSIEMYGFGGLVGFYQSFDDSLLIQQNMIINNVLIEQSSQSLVLFGGAIGSADAQSGLVSVQQNIIFTLNIMEVSDVYAAGVIGESSGVHLSLQENLIFLQIQYSFNQDEPLEPEVDSIAMIIDALINSTLELTDNVMFAQIDDNASGLYVVEAFQEDAIVEASGNLILDYSRLAEGTDLASGIRPIAEESLPSGVIRVDMKDVLSSLASVRTFGSQVLTKLNGTSNAFEMVDEESFPVLARSSLQDWLLDLPIAFLFDLSTSIDIDEPAVYLIQTPEDLLAVSEAYLSSDLIDDGVNYTFVLANDIDMSGITNWIPIGGRGIDSDNNQVVAAPGKGFRGTFDGSGFTIHHLLIDVSELSADSNNGVGLAGLFGRVSDGAVIENLVLSHTILSGVGLQDPLGSVGVLAGEVIADSGVTIRNITVEQPYINLTSSGEIFNVGGMIGGIALFPGETLTILHNLRLLIDDSQAFVVHSDDSLTNVAGMIGILFMDHPVDMHDLLLHVSGAMVSWAAPGVSQTGGLMGSFLGDASLDASGLQVQLDQSLFELQGFVDGFGLIVGEIESRSEAQHSMTDLLVSVHDTTISMDALDLNDQAAGIGMAIGIASGVTVEHLVVDLSDSTLDVNGYDIVLAVGGVVGAFTGGVGERWLLLGENASVTITSQNEAEVIGGIAGFFENSTLTSFALQGIQFVVDAPFIAGIAGGIGFLDQSTISQGSIATTIVLEDGLRTSGSYVFDSAGLIGAGFSSDVAQVLILTQFEINDIHVISGVAGAIGYADNVGHNKLVVASSIRSNHSGLRSLSETLSWRGFDFFISDSTSLSSDSFSILLSDYQYLTSDGEVDTEDIGLIFTMNQENLVRYRGLSFATEEVLQMLDVDVPYSPGLIPNLAGIDYTPMALPWLTPREIGNGASLVSSELVVDYADLETILDVVMANLILTTPKVVISLDSDFDASQDRAGEFELVYTIVDYLDGVFREQVLTATLIVTDGPEPETDEPDPIVVTPPPTASSVIGPQFSLEAPTRSITHELGTRFVPPVVRGYEVVNRRSTDVTNLVEVTGVVNENRVGTYQLTYKLARPRMNSVSIVITVQVVDTVAPLIEAPEIWRVIQGTNESLPYRVSDASSTPLDVTLQPSLNLSILGEQAVTIVAVDASGNRAEQQVVVIVRSPLQERISYGIEDIELVLEVSEPLFDLTTLSSEVAVGSRFQDSSTLLWQPRSTHLGPLADGDIVYLRVRDAQGQTIMTQSDPVIRVVEDVELEEEPVIVGIVPLIPSNPLVRILIQGVVLLSAVTGMAWVAKDVLLYPRK
jgi:hypothetical protein